MPVSGFQYTKTGFSHILHVSTSFFLFENWMQISCRLIFNETLAFMSNELTGGECVVSNGEWTSDMLTLSNLLGSMRPTGFGALLSQKLA